MVCLLRVICHYISNVHLTCTDFHSLVLVWVLYITIISIVASAETWWRCIKSNLWGVVCPYRSKWAMYMFFLWVHCTCISMLKAYTYIYYSRGSMAVPIQVLSPLSQAHFSRTRHSHCRGALITVWSTWLITYNCSNHFDTTKFLLFVTFSKFSLILFYSSTVLVIQKCFNSVQLIFWLVHVMMAQLYIAISLTIDVILFVATIECVVIPLVLPLTIAWAICCALCIV